MTRRGGASSSRDLLGLIAGCWVSQAIFVAAKLRIADLLQSGPMHFTALAAATQTHDGTLYRLLRALASVDVFVEDAQGRFGLTSRAEALRSDAPGSLRAFAEMIGAQEHWRAWEGLLHSVKFGEAAFQHVFGTPFFDYLGENAEASRRFDEAMTSRGAEENLAVVAAYDFSVARTIIDVGGGQGSLVASILEKHAHVRGVVVDLPHVLEQSSPSTRSSCYGESWTAVEGDFFSGVPRGGDFYILKKVIHDWSDERARTILANCRSVMSSSARLLVVEPVIPAGNEPSFNKLLDVLMLVWHAGGRERTVREHEALLASAGLVVSRVIRTPCGLDVIEAMPSE